MLGNFPLHFDVFPLPLRELPEPCTWSSCFSGVSFGSIASSLRFPPLVDLERDLAVPSPDVWLLMGPLRAVRSCDCRILGCRTERGVRDRNSWDNRKTIDRSLSDGSVHRIDPVYVNPFASPFLRVGLESQRGRKSAKRRDRARACRDGLEERRVCRILHFLMFLVRTTFTSTRERTRHARSCRGCAFTPLVGF